MSMDKSTVEPLFYNNGDEEIFSLRREDSTMRLLAKTAAIIILRTGNLKGFLDTQIEVYKEKIKNADSDEEIGLYSKSNLEMLLCVKEELNNQYKFTQEEKDAYNSLLTTYKNDLKNAYHNMIDAQVDDDYKGEIE